MTFLAKFSPYTWKFYQTGQFQPFIFPRPLSLKIAVFGLFGREIGHSATVDFFSVQKHMYPVYCTHLSRSTSNHLSLNHPGRNHTYPSRCVIFILYAWHITWRAERKFRGFSEWRPGFLFRLSGPFLSPAPSLILCIVSHFLSLAILCLCINCLAIFFSKVLCAFSNYQIILFSLTVPPL